MMIMLGIVAEVHNRLATHGFSSVSHNVKRSASRPTPLNHSLDYGEQ